MPFKYATLIDRVIANTVLSKESFYNGTPCWEWTGNTTTNEKGYKYGRITRRLTRGPRKGQVSKEFAHRVVLKGIKGRKLTTKSVCRHLCNNTLCVNPDHLAGGTQATNMRQCVREGRHGNAYRAPVADARVVA